VDIRSRGATMGGVEVVVAMCGIDQMLWRATTPATLHAMFRRCHEGKR
jgi:hypothetical protein